MKMMMTKNRVLSLLLLVLLYFCLAKKNFAQQTVGEWNTISLEKDFSKEVAVFLDTEVRTIDFNQIDLCFFIIGSSYKYSKFLKFSLAYRMAAKSPFDDDLSFRHKGIFDVSTKYELENLKFAYRSRIQAEFKNVLTSKNGEKAEWIWRNKAEVKYSLGRFEPYLGAELYYLIHDPRNTQNDNLFNEYRLFLGCDFALAKRKEIGLYVMKNQEIQMSTNSSMYVIGLEFTYSFPKHNKKTNDETHD